MATRDFAAMKAAWDARASTPAALAIPAQADPNLETVASLIDRGGLTAWENSFCLSIERWLQNKPGPLSPKQQMVVNKLKDKYLGTDPAPVAKKPTPQALLLKKPPVKHWQDEDEDEDDIPF